MAAVATKTEQVSLRTLHQNYRVNETQAGEIRAEEGDVLLGGNALAFTPLHDGSELGLSDNNLVSIFNAITKNKGKGGGSPVLGELQGALLAEVTDVKTATNDEKAAAVRKLFLNQNELIDAAVAADLSVVDRPIAAA